MGGGSSYRFRSTRLGLASARERGGSSVGHRLHPTARDLFEEAKLEYEQCRRGIEKYDDHLFRIRQWNISLSAVAIAAIVGFVQTEVSVAGSAAATSRFSPSLALFVYTLVALNFWLLDSLNKSLQAVHVHNCRDIEKYLRGTEGFYIGPTISLRFQRKHNRHYLGTIKNLTDTSIVYFYIMPIIVFWMAVCIKFWPIDNFYSINHINISSSRIAALSAMALIIVLILKSLAWKYLGRRRTLFGWRWRFILRPYAHHRRTVFEDIFEKLNDRKICDCDDKRKLCKCNFKYNIKTLRPFKADLYCEQNNTLIFIDRLKLFRSPFYIEERDRYLSEVREERFNIINVKWERTGSVIWGRRWRMNYDIEELRAALSSK